jgi:Rap1a immunity proteins
MTLRRRAWRALTAALWVLVLTEAGAALAQDANGQASMGKEPGARLQTRCEPLRNPAGPLGAAEQADIQACLGFIEGFVWGHAWAAWRSGTDMWFCLPQGFSGRQGVSAVIDYLDAHPDRLSEDSHLLVFLALTAAYPCKP